jgi:hypothetical protein
MDIEEVYDKIGSNYPYTYDLFLKTVTPKLANRLLEIISIRETNDYWYAASLHGVNVKDKIIKPRTETKAATASKEQQEITKKYLANLANRGKK